jgi:FkbM family methyltransferase
MMKVLAGRVWRRANRLLSRAWLRTQIDSGDFQFERFGEGHAAWWVLKDIKPGSIAYCGGVGQDATFDFDLAEKMGMEVHSFDPTPNSIAYMERENRGRVDFHAWGMLDCDRTIRFHAPLDQSHANWFVDNLHGTDNFFEADCFTIATIMKKLGHETIELLKIDIEGSWNRVLSSMLESRIYPRIVCVEFDSPAPLLRVRRTVRALQSAGYRLARRDKENCVFVREG